MDVRDLVQKIWEEGMQDIQHLRTQRGLLEVIADSSDEPPSVVDYDGTKWFVYFTTVDRVVIVEFSRFTSLANVVMVEQETETRHRATSATIREAFRWLKPMQAATASEVGGM
jgi:hypothetical protein